jgi:hypothetical protein
MNKLEHAVDVILQSKSLADAATALQIDPATLWRWRQKPEFQTVLAKRRRDLVGDLYSRLAGMSGKLADTIEHLLDHGTNADGTKLRTLALALENLRELFKHIDLAEDLAEVKKLLREQSNVGGRELFV